MAVPLVQAVPSVAGWRFSSLPRGRLGAGHLREGLIELLRSGDGNASTSCDCSSVAIAALDFIDR
jgi:hypothetical protein